MADGQNPFDFDLRLVPDWMKEEEPKNRYADYKGESPRDRRGKGPQQRGPRRDSRDSRDRKSGGGGPRDRQKHGDRDRREPRGRREGGPRDARDSGHRGGPRQRDAQGPRQPRQPLVIEGLQFDFMPEPRGMEGIRTKVLESKLAYPLFALAKMFLEQVERCRIKLHAQAPLETLYQIGQEGEVALQKSLLERPAFEAHKAELYEEIRIEADEIKGNFQNVARCRASGTLLGPTNYHGYQPALRHLYEARFSRRMSFSDFQQQIEVVSDLELVEKWKEDAKVSIQYKPRDGEDAPALKTLADVLADFRTRHFDRLVRSTPSASFAGTLVPKMADRHLARAILDARYEFSKFPLRMANHLRSGFQQQGGHVFKHKKRVLFASVHRPVPFTGDPNSLAPGAKAILDLVREEPMCDRKRLLAKCAPESQAPNADADTIHQAKARLAADLHWLIQAGHIIEFHDSKFDLPVLRKPDPAQKSEPPGKSGSKPTQVQQPIPTSTNSKPSPVSSPTMPQPTGPDPTTPPISPDPTAPPAPDPTVVPPPTTPDPTTPPVPDPSLPTEPEPEIAPEAPEPSSSQGADDQSDKTDTSSQSSAPN